MPPLSLPGFYSSTAADLCVFVCLLDSYLLPPRLLEPSTERMLPPILSAAPCPVDLYGWSA